MPGEECLARLVSGTLPPPDGAVTTTTAPKPVTTTTVAGGATGSTVPVVTTTTAAVVVQITSGTLVPDNVLDPRAPMPSIDTRTFVYRCGEAPLGVVVQKKNS